MALATTAAIILALKAAHDVARDARDGDDPDMMKSAAHDLSRILSNALCDMRTLQAEVLELMCQAERAAAHRAKDRYVRVQSRGGAHVYIERHLAHDSDASPHYCAGCFERGHRALLEAIGVGGIAKCPDCGATPCTGR